MKICKGCMIEKPLSEFYMIKGKIPSWRCKKCSVEYSKKYHKDNQEYKCLKQRERSKEIREWFRSYKSTLHCSKCKFSHPASLQFHHLDPKIKDNSITFMVQQAHSKESILKEIEKCIILCANCHFILHYDEKNVDYY